MKSIKIHEVGLRDGLQMESEPVPTNTKELWIELLMKANLDIIQLGSFVNLVKMPQMADTDDLFDYCIKEKNRIGSSILSGLVLNRRGLERAIKSGVELICLGLSASDTHSTKNTGKSTDENLNEILSMSSELINLDIHFQVSIQSAFGCGFEGDIPEDRIFNLVDKYKNIGIKSISLADTAGYANPGKVKRMVQWILNKYPDTTLSCHFHNTYGMGLANVMSAIEEGVEIIETSFGGLGGCPFTKSPSGNVCTEDFVNLIQEMGYRKDIDVSSVIKVAKHASGFFVKELPGFVHKIGMIKH